jgi:DNA-binding transcriptional ArsR family regulator
VLRDAGIVESERQGLWSYYYVLPGTLDELAAWLGGRTRSTRRVDADHAVRLPA